MLLFTISGMVFCRFCFLMLLNPGFIWNILRVGDIMIKDYYLGSSTIYSTHRCHKVKKRGTLLSQRPEFLFDVKLYNDGRSFTVFIRQRDSDILMENTEFLKISNTSGFSYSIAPLESHLYEGYIVDYPDNSSVNGYVKNNNFYGLLIVNNIVYYLDELRDHKIGWNTELPAANRTTLIFQKDSVMIEIFLNDTESVKDLYRELMKRRDYKHEFQSWKQNGMLCPIVIVIDNSFLTVVHNSNVEAATFHILFSLEEANSIFRSTDIDGNGTPDNIGFYVKKMTVMDVSGPTHFTPVYQKSEMSIKDYIAKAINYDELPNHCLGIFFTAQKFEGRTLGASFTPDSNSVRPVTGICEQRNENMETMNALVITASTTHTSLINQVVFEVTITHELGHSFGSTHDEDPKCEGYLMAPKSYATYDSRSKMMFSSCSTAQIMKLLVLRGTKCMEPVKTSFCGNSIVEDGEDCDCGLTRDCLERDPCCVPRRTTKYPCKINKKRGFQCHPSQGECCTSDCKYSTRLEKFVNCKNFDATCPCADNNISCFCGLNGMCIEDECHSVECVRLGLEECQCSNQTIDKTCQICCQYEDDCLPAMKATNHALSPEVLSKILQMKTEESIQKIKSFVEKRFCIENRCIKLQFFRSKVEENCLYRGKLGKCLASSQCKILKLKQDFPKVQSASSRYRQKYLHLIYYLVLNGFLIYVFC